MSIKTTGGIFGRNPTFNDVEVDGTLTVGGNTVPDASTILVDGDIGSTVEAYDATILKSADIGSTVQGYDADTAKLDVAQSWSAKQTFVSSSVSGTETITEFSRPTYGLCLGIRKIAGSGGILSNQNLYISADDSNTQTAAASNIIFQVDGSEKARINSLGNLAFISGSGIDFSATAGTGTSELFDDYEEGTWTPTYTASSGGAATYNVQSGKYTKIGNKVTVIGELQAQRSTLSGNISIGGLPFSNSGNGGGMFITFAINFATDMPNFRGYASSTTLALRKQATNSAGSTTITEADLSDAATNHNYLYFTAVYLTS